MPADPWESGNPYEYFMGRWSRPAAREFLDWLSFAERLRWLDVGCGTGVLSSAILEAAAPQEILGVDASEAFIGFAQQNQEDTRLRFQVADARQLPAETDHFDDYWAPFLGGQGPAPGYVMALNTELRMALKSRLQAMLPVLPARTIALIARAWSIRGVV